MAPTVDELRNEIRQAVGRFERPGSTAFTKESLVAICDAVDADVETEPTPPKAEMRAGILRAAGVRADADPEDADRSFRKAELRSIADAVGVE